jgi:hypothetical protein
MDNRLCGVCRQLDSESLTRDELPRSHPISYMLGPLHDILARQSECQFCHLAICALSAAWNQVPPATIDGQPVLCTLRNRAVGVVTGEKRPLRYSENFAANEYKYSNCRIMIVCDRAPADCPSTAEIQAFGEGPDIRGLFDDAALFTRRPQSQLIAINFDLVRNWLSYCSQFHGDQCKKDTLPRDHRENYSTSFRVIDVLRHCVADAEADCSYVALSYVWGQAPMLKLIQSNKSELYHDGALTQERQSIPRTIRDAILVVKQLRKKYIWVDALCILQDDQVEKEKVIGEMDLIYSRAELTLVAASGRHADAGLPGLMPGTRTVHAFDARMAIGAKERGKELVTARSRPSTIIACSKWNSRGWTYQERLFSHRMLLFTDEQLLYWCGRSSWCEDTVLETDNEHVHYEERPLYRFSVPNNPSAPFMKQAEESPSVSMFEEYSKIVSEYSRRDLSFQGDVLDAFAGLLRRFRASYEPNSLPLNYFFGLPSAWFELSLLWNPLANSPKIRRRGEMYHMRSGVDIPFPSWSWTGWVGVVEYRYPQNIEARTQSEIQWYSFDLAGTLFQLAPSKYPSHPLPPWFGSSDKPRPLRKHWRPDGAPVDVGKTGVLNRESHNHSGTNFLMFYSSSALLPVVERHDGLVPQGCGSNSVSHYFIAGEGKGWIQIDSDWIASHLGPLYEFVVISRSREDDWREPGMLDMLNVMLIEWRDGVAYRVGVGTVAESVWVLSEPKWKFIQLG